MVWPWSLLDNKLQWLLSGQQLPHCKQIHHVVWMFHVKGLLQLYISNQHADWSMLLTNGQTVLIGTASMPVGELSAATKTLTHPRMWGKRPIRECISADWHHQHDMITPRHGWPGGYLLLDLILIFTVWLLWNHKSRPLMHVPPNEWHLPDCIYLYPLVVDVTASLELAWHGLCWLQFLQQ